MTNDTYELAENHSGVRTANSHSLQMCLAPTGRDMVAQGVARSASPGLKVPVGIQPCRGARRNFVHAAQDDLISIHPDIKIDLMLHQNFGKFINL